MPSAKGSARWNERGHDGRRDGHRFSHGLEQVGVGHTGADTYFLGSGFGQDILFDHDTAAAVTDEVHFGATSYNHLWFKQVGSNLEVSVVGSASTLTVQGWFLGADHQVVLFHEIGGHDLSAQNVQGLVTAMSAFTMPQDLSTNATLTAARDAAWVTM